MLFLQLYCIIAVALFSSASGRRKKCEDSPSLIFPRDGQNLNCAQFIAKYPCQCRESIPSALRTIVVKKECCKSCMAADLSECNCQNMVSMRDPIRIPGFDGNFIPINSCDELSRDWPELCKKFGNKKKTPCCKACKGVSTKCFDSKLVRFNSEIATDLNCQQFIAEDICNCAVAQQECCESCKNFKFRDCCLNDPSYKASVTIRLNRKKVRCRKCNCNELLETNVFLMKKACDEDINGAKTRCCKNCAVINPNP